jgi:hypothetical protein
VSKNSKYQTLEAMQKAPQVTAGVVGLASMAGLGTILAADAMHYTMKPIPHDGSTEAILSAMRGDVDLVQYPMSTLKKNLKLYDSTISKKKEYKDLANMLKRDMLSPLDAFGKGFAQMAAAQGKEINKVENNIRNVTAMVIKESGKLTTQFKAMNKEMSGIAKKYADGVPDNDKKNLVRFMKDVGVKVKQAPGGIKMLDGELNDLVSEYARDHRPLINKYNSTLGKAKKGVKESSQEVKRAKGYLTALAGVLKKA